MSFENDILENDMLDKTVDRPHELPVKEGGNNLTVGSKQKKNSVKKLVIETKIDVDNITTSFQDCEIIFKQNGFIRVVNGNINIKNCKITVDREFYNNEKIIYLEENSKGEISDSEIDAANQKSPGIGVFNSSLEINNCKFTGFYAEDPGAAVFAKDSDLVIKNCSFNNCKSTSSGGAIQFSADSITTQLSVRECVFNDCYSYVNG